MAPTTSRPETSTRTAQNILFALGGLLLATAAIVFTAVAWATFGNGGRAVILASVTLITLAVPPLALRRGLRATGETFAVLGFLLTVLDGYAAWYVNLFGAKAVPTLSYVAIVCAVTAALGGVYHLATSLTGPGVVAVLVVQPVLPLLAADAGLTATGWSLLLAAQAAANLALARRRRDVVVGALGLVAHGGALAASAVLALRAEVQASGGAEAATAGLALVAVAAVLLPERRHRGELDLPLGGRGHAGAERECRRRPAGRHRLAVAEPGRRGRGGDRRRPARPDRPARRAGDGPARRCAVDR